jgi:hypothetical protein
MDITEIAILPQRLKIRMYNDLVEWLAVPLPHIICGGCWRPALFQALSLEVYATVRLGRAPLLGRSRSTERVCPCVSFRVNQRQD